MGEYKLKDNMYFFLCFVSIVMILLNIYTLGINMDWKNIDI